LSWWIGYLSPDSWAYFRLAEATWISAYPSIEGTYQSGYPSGYPLLIAAAFPGAGSRAGAQRTSAVWLMTRISRAAPQTLIVPV